MVERIMPPNMPAPPTVARWAAVVRTTNYRFATGTATFTTSGARYYVVDTHSNGHGCNYVTTAHEPEYWDYSTGFRCCADAGKDAGAP